MKNLTIAKAGRIATPVESLTITFETEPPDRMEVFEAAELYEREASLLAESLWNVLPGGTMDRLIGKLFERRASLFIIPFGQPEHQPQQKEEQA